MPYLSLRTSSLVIPVPETFGTVAGLALRRGRPCRRSREHGRIVAGHSDRIKVGPRPGGVTTDVLGGDDSAESFAVGAAGKMILVRGA
jgi:hypothetical protein